jgi:hypothetical protein
MFECSAFGIGSMLNISAFYNGISFLRAQSVKKATTVSSLQLLLSQRIQLYSWMGFRQVFIYKEQPRVMPGISVLKQMFVFLARGHCMYLHVASSGRPVAIIVMSKAHELSDNSANTCLIIA